MVAFLATVTRYVKTLMQKDSMLLVLSTVSAMSSAKSGPHAPSHVPLPVALMESRPSSAFALREYTEGKLASKSMRLSSDNL